MIGIATSTSQGTGTSGAQERSASIPQNQGSVIRNVYLIRFRG